MKKLRRILAWTPIIGLGFMLLLFSVTLVGLTLDKGDPDVLDDIIGKPGMAEANGAFHAVFSLVPLVFILTWC